MLYLFSNIYVIKIQIAKYGIEPQYFYIYFYIFLNQYT